MRKALIIGGVILGIAISCGCTFLIMNRIHNKELENLTSQVATLNATIDAIGPVTTCFTVQSTTFPGQEITEDLIVEQSIPQSFKNSTFATAQDLVGLYSKISITPGTPITVDMVMKEKLVDSLREIDISGNRWPIGLKEGDYVDLRLTYPRGEDFVVLSHKRVMSITEQTLKIHMTEEEQHLYQAALVDFYLSREYGSDIYLTKYVEPGLQQSAWVYYSVPANIEAVCRKDPNIIDIAQVEVQKELRNLINAGKAEFDEDDDSGSKISSGRNELNSKVNSDFGIYAVEQENNAGTTSTGGEGGGNDSLITSADQGVS